MIRDELRLDHYHLPEVEVKKLWLALDQDGSGHIDAGEFGRFMRCGAPQRGKGAKSNLNLSDVNASPNCDMKSTSCVPLVKPVCAKPP